MLYSHSTADKLLGCYLQRPELCLDSKYPIDKEEFQVLFHRILYATIYNLAINGCKSVSVMDIDEFVKPYESEYNVLQDNTFEEYVATITELTDADNFEYYYKEFRKFSCLNVYKEKGFDIKQFYDEDKSEDSQLENLNKYEIEDIVNYFEKQQSDIRKQFLLNDKIEVMTCGDGFDELLDELEEEPMIGAGLCSPTLNNLYRGWCKGHLVLRGSPSSFGKTTMGISDQNNVSVLKVWSDEKQDFIENPYYQGMGAYIHTEQKMREEIQPRFMANISGIPYHKILDGDFTKDEKERLSEAGRIVKESNLKLINYPMFTSNGLRELIKNLSLEGYEYVTFDYCWDNFYIGSELKAISGTAIRQDMSLLHLVDTLKMSAEEFDVGVSTMIQLNGREKEVEIVDESCLFGSKSVKTKLDNGSIYMYPRQKELKQVEPLIVKWNNKYNKNNFGNTIIPNAVSHCFKTRYGRFGQNVKVWHYVDNGIGKMTDMFATTWDNKPIDIPPLYIERK